MTSKMLFKARHIYIENNTSTGTCSIPVLVLVSTNTRTVAPVRVLSLTTGEPNDGRLTQYACSCMHFFFDSCWMMVELGVPLS
eukprot:SAG11_NODE_32848_length_280_cov_0.944751_1_plen_82_part_01